MQSKKQAKFSSFLLSLQKRPSPQRSQPQKVGGHPRAAFLFVGETQDDGIRPKQFSLHLLHGCVNRRIEFVTNVEAGRVQSWFKFVVIVDYRRLIPRE